MWELPSRIARTLAAWVFVAFVSLVFWVTSVCGLPTAGYLWSVRVWGPGIMWCLGIRLDIENPEHLRGPAVFISNHESLAEGFLLPALLPATLKFVAKQELARVPFWGWALKRTAAIFIDRSDPSQAVHKIREALRHLPAGWSVVLMPEGTRSVDGTLGRFKKGAFHIAMQAGLPVVPIGIAGARDIVPKGGWLPRRAKVFVHVGAPMDTSTWTAETIDLHVDAGRNAVLHCVGHARARRASHTREV